VVPSADFSDPVLGRIEADDWSVEVSIGEHDLCSKSVALHVRGSNKGLGAVAAILERLGF